jgi:hypothetical protein
MSASIKVSVKTKIKDTSALDKQSTFVQQTTYKSTTGDIMLKNGKKTPLPKIKSSLNATESVSSSTALQSNTEKP